MRRPLVLVLVWFVGTAVAVTLSTVAVAQISDRVTDRGVATVSADEVEREVELGEALEPLERELGGEGAEVEEALEGADEGDGVAEPEDDSTPLSSTTVAGAPGGGSSSGSGSDEIDAEDGDESASAVPPAPATTAAAAPTEVANAFSLPGGTVTVGCTGASIRLIAYAPSSGWVVDGTPKNGPTEVEVKFRSEDLHSELKAQCQAGTPVAETSTSGAGDEDEADDPED